MEPCAGAGGLPDVLHCAKCGEPLKIVCDAHGTDWVPDRRLAVAPEQAPRKNTSVISRREAIAVAGSQRARILEALSTDRGNPSGANDIARATGIRADYVGIDLSILARDGRIERVARGRYVKAA